MSDGQRCEKCGSEDIEVRIVNEVEVMGVMNAVGPYEIHECHQCGHEKYEH